MHGGKQERAVTEPRQANHEPAHLHFYTASVQDTAMDDFIRRDSSSRTSALRRTSTARSDDSTRRKSRSNHVPYSIHRPCPNVLNAKAKLIWSVLRISIISILLISLVALRPSTPGLLIARWIPKHPPPSLSKLYQTDHPFDHLQRQHAHQRQANHQVLQELTQLTSDPRRSTSHISEDTFAEIHALSTHVQRGYAYHNVHEAVYDSIVDRFCEGSACKLNHDRATTLLSLAMQDVRQQKDQVDQIKAAITETGISMNLFIYDTLTRTPYGEACHLLRGFHDCGLPYLERAHAVVTLLGGYLDHEMMWYKSLEASFKRSTRANPFEEPEPGAKAQPKSTSGNSRKGGPVGQGEQGQGWRQALTGGWERVRERFF